MPSTIKKLTERQLIRPPSWLPNAVQYEIYAGSVAFGVSSDTSDMDLYSWCVPKKDIVFPHLAGEVLGFGRQIKRFEQYQQHGIISPDDLGGNGRTYDIQCYSIVKYFQLCMGGNPTLIDSLYVPVECILHMTQVGNMVRENRKLFLSKKVFHTYKGYSFSQMGKIKTKSHVGLDEVREWETSHNIPHETALEDVAQEKECRFSGGNPRTPLDHLTNEELIQYFDLYTELVAGSKRAERVKCQTWDTKFGYHLVRLLSEVEMLLTEGDMDIRRHCEHLKAIRRGDVSENDVMKWATEKERHIESLYNSDKCPLPYEPNETKIKALLLRCLEQYFGSLEGAIVAEDAATSVLKELADVIDRNRHLLT